MFRFSCTYITNEVDSIAHFFGFPFLNAQTKRLVYKMEFSITSFHVFIVWHNLFFTFRLLAQTTLRNAWDWD